MPRPPVAPDGQCETCDYRQGHYCFRYPAQLVPVLVNNDPPIYEAYPMVPTVNLDDWCGEFMPERTPEQRRQAFKKRA